MPAVPVPGLQSPPGGMQQLQHTKGDGNPNTEMESLIPRIEELEDKVEFLLNHETVAHAPVSRDEKAANEAPVVDLWKKGNMKEAMKLHRVLHVMPFSQAQQEIEALKKMHAI
jgi:hypothetical protein